MPQSIDGKLIQFISCVRNKKKIPDEILIYVAEGVGRYLSGNKTAWPKTRGKGKYPSENDYLIWFDLRTTDLPKTRETKGGALQVLSKKYSKSESAIFDSTRRVQDYIDSMINDDNYSDSHWLSTYLFVKFNFDREKIAIAEKNNFWYENKGTA